VATRQPFHDRPAVKNLLAIGGILAIVVTLSTIYEGVIKLRSNGSSVEQRSDQTATGTRNARQSAKAGRDATQKTTTVHGDVDSLTTYQGQKEKDPDTVEGAREALGRMGLKFDEEGFADANRESNLDAIKLYLRGGKSPNTAYSGTFMICLSLMNKSQQFPAILKLYQTQGREPLDFATKVGPSPTPLQALMTRANSDYTMADVIFRQLAYEDDPYAKTMGRLLWESGANPSVLMHTLQSDKSKMESFLSSPQNRQNDAMQRKFGMTNTSGELARTNKQLAFLESVIPNE